MESSTAVSSLTQLGTNLRQRVARNFHPLSSLRNSWTAAFKQEWEQGGKQVPLERPRRGETREEETLLRESKADNLTNDIYTPTLMSGFMSGNSLRAAVGCQGLQDQYQVHNEAHRCNYTYDSLVSGQSLPPSSQRRVSRWPSLQMLRTLETLASASKVINASATLWIHRHI